MSTVLRLLLSLTLGALAATVAVGSTERTAHACSPFEQFVVPIDAFEDAKDLAALNASDGPVHAAFDDWAMQNPYPEDVVGDGPLASIVGVQRLTTVAVVNPPEGDRIAAQAGVVVYESVWGAVPADLSPTTYPFDLSPCSFLFAPPWLGTSEWVIITEPDQTLTLSPAVADFGRLEQELTRLFGRPVRPALDVDDVVASLDLIVAQGQEAFGQQVGAIERLPGVDPDAPEPPGLAPNRQAGIDDEEVIALNDDPPTGDGKLGLVIVLAVAAAVMAVLASLTWRRRTGAAPG